MFFLDTVSFMRKSENVKKNHLEESLLFHDQGGIEESECMDDFPSV